MKKDITKESDMDYCEKDNKHRHYWENVGVIHIDNQGEFQVFKCTQCSKCKSNKLVYVKLGNWYQL